ncbi:MAG: hypothetical protein H6710_02440 [Myxococcales bacterium]|nr:hypothetical protein [Myxococcales bacterium]
MELRTPPSRRPHVGLLAIAAAALVACSGGEGESEATSTSGAATTTATTSTSGSTGSGAATETSGGGSSSGGGGSTSSGSTSGGCEALIWYADSDGDTYGDPEVTTRACEQPEGYVDNDLDCDDSEPLLNPETTWHPDADNDSYGDAETAVVQCEPLAGHVLDDGDCDDGDPAVNPLATEAVCADLGVDRNCDGVPAPLCASCLTLKEDGKVAADGVYTVDPDGGDPSDAVAVFCDMTSDGGGWTLLMRITGTSTGHALLNNAFGPKPCVVGGMSCRLSSADISRFIAAPGIQVFEIRPDDPQFISWYVRAAIESETWPTNLQANNRPAMAANPNEAWILTSYQSSADAFAGANGDTGAYEGAGHYYPTPYPGEQIFFKGSQAGLRVNTGWVADCCNDNQPGTLWVR